MYPLELVSVYDVRTRAYLDYVDGMVHFLWVAPSESTYGGIRRSVRRAVSGIVDNVSPLVAFGQKLTMSERDVIINLEDRRHTFPVLSTIDTAWGKDKDTDYYYDITWRNGKCFHNLQMMNLI